MKRVFLPIYLIIAITFVECKTKKTVTALVIQKESIDSTVIKDSVPTIFYKKIAEKKYGQTCHYLLNQNGEYVICYKLNKPSKYIPNNNLQFFIFNRSNNKVIFEDILYDGKVSWIKPYVIKVISKPEIIKKGTSGITGYLYDVKEEKKESIIQ